MIKKTVLGIIVITCMVAIFLFSAQEATDSSKTSFGFIETILRFFDFRNTLSESEISAICNNLMFFIRKVAHFSIYAVLSFFIMLMLNEYKLSILRRCVFTVVLAFIYACSDEIHQYFVPGRSAKITDVFIDSAGAVCGMLAAFLFCFIINKLTKGRKPYGLQKKL